MPVEVVAANGGSATDGLSPANGVDCGNGVACGDALDFAGLAEVAGAGFDVGGFGGCCAHTETGITDNIRSRIDAAANGSTRNLVIKIAPEKPYSDFTKRPSPYSPHHRGLFLVLQIPAGVKLEG